MSRIAHYKYKVEKAITHGHHEEPKASHDDGVYYTEFCENRKELEKAVDEYL
jgi:hypothetical protein